MQSLSQGDWSAEDVRAALHASSRRVAFRYELLGSDNIRKGWLDGVTKCTVENNALATIKRTAKFEIRDVGDVDWVSDRIRPWFRLWMGSEYAEWPMGIFLLSSPKRQVNTAGAMRSVEAYDQLLVLEDDKTENRYTVETGTNYIAAVADLLTAAGVTGQNLVSTDKALPSDRDWPPGTSILTIIGDLLSSINYRSLYFNSAGRAVAEPYQRPSSRPTGYAYKANSQSLLEPNIEVDFDLFGVPNKWVLTVSEPDRPELVSTYTNEEESSPTSTISRGRTIVALHNVDAADQSSLDDKAERLAFESSQVYEIVEANTAIMPHHEDHEVIRLDYPEAELSSRYTEHKWSMELKAGASMKHTLRRLVTV